VDIEASIQRLEYLVRIIPPLLGEIKEEEFSFKPSAHKWSGKEILGHLVDSATNNHQRFIRAQFEDRPLISYNQDQWNKCSQYNSIESSQLIQFWTLYNKHLIEIIKRIPSEDLKKECRSGNGGLHTIAFLFNDYVSHLEHHLKQIVEYPQ
jgi:hypothetical protein